ncbi:MAG: HYR domain-containing protein [Bacteroidota bacterium]
MKIRLILLFLILANWSNAQVTMYSNLPAGSSVNSLEVRDGKLYARVKSLINGTRGDDIRVWNDPANNNSSVIEISASGGISDKGFAIAGDTILYANEVTRLLSLWDGGSLFFLGSTVISNQVYVEAIQRFDPAFSFDLYNVYLTGSLPNTTGPNVGLYSYNEGSLTWDFITTVNNSQISGMTSDGDILYFIAPGKILTYDTSDPNPTLNTLNNNVVAPNGIEIVGDFIYYIDNICSCIRRVSKTIVNDTPVDIASGLNAPTDLKYLNGTFYISDMGPFIFQYTPPPAVAIPDANLKAALVANTSIDTNSDAEIQVSEASAFTGSLNLDNLSISDLTGIEAFTAATSLDISGNPVTEVDFSFSNSFTSITGDQISASSINLTGSASLENISFNSSTIGLIDLSSNPMLKEISFQGGALLAIDLTNNSAVEKINLSGCNLTQLDLSAKSTLKDIDMSNNKLSLFSIANGNNAAITDFKADGNPDLQCIEIDAGFTPPSTWIVDATTSFSDNCAALTDIEGPVATCQDITVSLDASGSAVITAEQFDGGSTDNIGIASLSLDKTVFGCSDLGANTVTLTVTDHAGNSDECTATVTIIDDLPPTIQIANLIVNNDPGMCNAVVSSFGGIESDNCTILEPITYSNVPVGNVFPVGTTTITASIFDISGNTASEDFTVTVVDNESPALSVSDTSVHVGPNTCTATVEINPIASDNCSAAITYQNLPADNLFSVGTTAVTAIATDPSGNTTSQSFNVIVLDTISPIINGTDITVLLNQDPDNTCGAAVDLNSFLSATDNCAIAQFTFDNLPADGVFPIGTTTIKSTAVDLSGNSSSKEHTVTIVDNVLPVLTVSDVTTNNDLGQCFATVSLSASATDNCQVTLSYSNVPDKNEFPVGTTTVTATATDDSGNEVSKDFTVTVLDQEDPSITVTDINVVNDPGECGAIVQMNAIAEDNCAATVTYANVPAGNLFPVGVITVTATATDDAGNFVSADFDVTVSDNIPPVITCTPGDLTEITTSDSFTLPDYVASGVATATDNCTVSISQDPAAGTQLVPGSYQITFTASDSDGNTDTCVKNLNIEKVLSNADDQSNDLLVYPNPVSSMLTIESKSHDVQISIYSVSGRRLLQTAEKTVDMSSFTPGTYLIHITEDDKTLIRRILKQ